MQYFGIIDKNVNISIAMEDWKYFWHVSAIFCAMWQLTDFDSCLYQVSDCNNYLRAQIVQNVSRSVITVTHVKRRRILHMVFSPREITTYVHYRYIKFHDRHSGCSYNHHHGYFGIEGSRFDMPCVSRTRATECRRSKGVGKLAVYLYRVQSYSGMKQ